MRDGQWVVWLVGGAATLAVLYGAYKIIQSAIGSIRSDREKMDGKTEWKVMNDVNPPEYNGDTPGEIW